MNTAVQIQENPLGNAATNVAYPLTTICLAIALLIGIGSASRFSLHLGAGEKDKVRRVLVELFLHPLLTAFGATADVLPYAIDYTRITAVGMPFLIVTNGMSNSLNQVAITFVQIVLNNSLTYYGASSPYGTDIPLAACGIVMKTNAILLAFIIGISQGSQPIIAFVTTVILVGRELRHMRRLQGEQQ